MKRKSSITNKQTKSIETVKAPEPVENEVFIDLSGDQLVKATRETAEKFNIDFDKLPNGLQTTMLMSQYLEGQKATENYIMNIETNENAVTHMQSIPTGIPSTVNMLPVFKSFPDMVQLNIENLLQEGGWYDHIISSPNISDEIKYHISNALNNLAYRNLSNSFFINCSNAFYALIERAVKILDQIYGISIDINLFLQHPEFQRVAHGQFKSVGIFDLIFEQYPIPVIAEYNHYTNSDVLNISLEGMNPDEYTASIEAYSMIKAQRLANEYYMVYVQVLRDIIYSSDTMNNYLDLSTLYNLCLTNTTFLFENLTLQFKVFIVQATSVALYNGRQSVMREGLVFELEDDE